MKTSPIPLAVSAAVVVATIVACGLGPVAAPAPSEADLKATVDAAVAATGTAQADLAATVSAAVAATSAAGQPTATATTVVQATYTTAPTAVPPTAAPATPVVAPTAAPPVPTVDASTMSEEELAAAIDAAVTAAVAATQQATAATTTAASDGTLSAEETVAMQVTFTNAEEAIALAESLVGTYNQVYGEYASESLSTLQAIEDDLTVMAENSQAIAGTLEQGSEAASAAITKIQVAAAAANASAAQAQAHSQGWLTKVQGELGTRASGALATQPTEIAADRQGALQSAAKYLETVRAGLADGKVSPAELTQIAQSGANASASIKAQGGPQLQTLAGSIDGITQQVARGELPQAKKGVDGLAGALPKR
jgi:hypothetical protein